MINGYCVEEHLIDSNVRYATQVDIPQFLSAAREFTKRINKDFDPEHFSQMMMEYIERPDFAIFVVDNKPMGFCIVALTNCVYSDNIEARIVATWGKGGLRCFNMASKWAEFMGAKHLFADVSLEPRMTSFYQRQTMWQVDTVFCKDF